MFDLVVLSIGLEISQETAGLCEKLGVALDHHHFLQTGSFTPVATSRPGIYACGAASGPKDIPQSVVEASAAACAAARNLAPVRNTLIREKPVPRTRSVAGERPRIGVFICDCGINIAGVIRVPEVLEYAKTLPYVEYVEENLFTCSQDTQDKIKAVIRDQRLNRIVVAACSPRTHEPLFQETLAESGLNKYLFEMANIRNMNSWVHAADPEAATLKAKDQVRMAVAKAALLDPLAGHGSGRGTIGAGSRRWAGRYDRGLGIGRPGLSGFSGGKIPATGRKRPPTQLHLEGRRHSGGT